MNILFLTIGKMDNIQEYSLYPDLLREFRKNGHTVYAVCARERRSGLPTELSEESGIHVLRVRIGNITKTNLIEKGISTVTVQQCFRSAIDRYLKGVRFDLIVYSTPPITFCSLVRYLKKRDNASTYLILKDIFPQNAVDLGMFGKKNPIYLYFRRQERELYRISDRIGCMSKGNMRYVTEHNPELDPKKVVLCPNAIEIRPQQTVNTSQVREKYGIPHNALTILFGGNLGKPQGIDFLISCLIKEKDRQDVFFLIAGSGTEYEKLQKAIEEEKLSNTCLIERLNSEDYNTLTAACDVGLIVLDRRFTIPNYPSRILSYMQEGRPILAATDPATDLRQTLEEGGFGWWCPSDDPVAFDCLIDAILSEKSNLSEHGARGRAYLEQHFNVSRCVKSICSDRKQKTLIVSRCFFPSVHRGGTAISATNLAKTLSEYMDVSVMTVSYESGSKAAFKEVHEGKNRLFDCDVYYLGKSKASLLNRTMSTIAPDMIYICSLFSADYTIPALRFAKKHKLPVVLAPHGELHCEALRHKKLKKYCYLTILKLSGLMNQVRFHATSSEEAEQILKSFPNAEVNEVQNLPRQLSAMKRTRIKMSGTLRAAAVCRVHPIKGLDRAIQVMRDVSANVEYDIYGPIEDKAYHAACISLAKELPPNISVHFHGAVKPEELPAIFSDTDVFLLPTKTENYCYAIVEALFCGIPAIISNGTPWKELEEHRAGVNSDTDGQYRQAIERFAAMDEAQWRVWSEGASAFINERLHVEETTSLYLKMLGVK